MSSRNVLLVALEPVAEDELKRAIERRKRDADVDVHVVAPASNIGTFKWLAGDEDEARAEAEELADHAAQAVDAEVETEVGDRDPLLAVEDALVAFPADEILLAGHADEKDEAALRRFGLPISRLDEGGEIPSEEPSGPEAVAHELEHGRRPETPFVILGVVAAILGGCDRADQPDRLHRLLPRLSEVPSVSWRVAERLYASGTVLRRTARSQEGGQRREAAGEARSRPGKRGAPGGIRTPDPRLRRPPLFL